MKTNEPSSDSVPRKSDRPIGIVSNPSHRTPNAPAPGPNGFPVEAESAVVVFLVVLLEHLGILLNSTTG
jgi:hypothetical protein